MSKVVLCILDGWGEPEHADPKHNAIHLAHTPCYTALIKERPFGLLQASGLEVGLPHNQPGNSEVGHMTIGAGRCIEQSLVRIQNALLSGEIEKRIGYLKAGQIVHVIGIISDGGVHGHIDHIIKICEYIKRAGAVVKLHAISDGRDVPPQSIKTYITILREHGLEVTTLHGRFYAMDRDGRSERTMQSLEVIAYGSDNNFTDVEEYIEQSYNNGITDEFIVPASASNYDGIKDGDILLLTNFRADRMIQLSAALFNAPIAQIHRKIAMCNYASGDYEVLIEEAEIHHVLGEVISKAGLSQLRIAETEKYAHVTYFLNAGRKDPFVGEDRIIVASPKVEDYSKTPMMSAKEVTDSLIDAMESGEYDFICVNYANADMLGHTGDLQATIKSIEYLDICLSAIVENSKKLGYELLVTSDHGNADCMYDEENGQPMTSHTLSRVPFIYIGYKNVFVKDGGLADIAPTVLKLLQIQKPMEMSGSTLI